MARVASGKTAKATSGTRGSEHPKCLFRSLPAACAADGDRTVLALGKDRLGLARRVDDLLATVLTGSYDSASCGRSGGVDNSQDGIVDVSEARDVPD